MRLGHTGTSYRYLTGEHSLTGATHRAGASLGRNGRTTAQYDWRGLPAPYFTTCPASPRDASPELRDVLRARQLGLSVVHTVITDWSSASVNVLHTALDQNHQELVPALGANLMLQGEPLALETARVTGLIQKYAEFGGIKVSKFSLSPMIANRFRTDPPLSEQLRRLTASLPRIVQAAEEAEIVLAFENHLDYRISEILEVLTAVESPALRVLFDTGNPFAVCEDPVGAALLAAPYTVLVHVKDVRVIPWTPMSPGYFACMYACPLGEGNVDLDAIVDILARNAPDPASLILAMEVRPVPPYLDEERWLEEGVEYMRARFPEHLES